MDDATEPKLPLRWPKSPAENVGEPTIPTTAHARMQRARRRGESAGDGWMLFFGVVIAVGYGGLLAAGVLVTWLKWPVLAVVLFMLWRHRPRRRVPPASG